MTITLNFTTIFAWVGGLVCAALVVYLLGWVVYGILGMGEFLGIWEALGRGIRASISWVWSKLTRQSKT